MSVLTVPVDISIGWHARWGARVLRPGCNPGCSQLIRITQAARVVRQRAVGQRIGKQARQESNLQPPVLERTPSNAGVEALVDFQALSSKRPTPASLDNAGVGTNPGTETVGQARRRPLWTAPQANQRTSVQTSSSQTRRRDLERRGRTPFLHSAVWQPPRRGSMIIRSP